MRGLTYGENDNKYEEKPLPDLGPMFYNDVASMPVALNIVQWLYGKNFLGINPDGGVFGKQLAILIEAFDDYCPKCSDPECLPSVNLDSKPEDVLDRVILLQHGVCPRCRYIRPIGRIHCIMAAIGQRSGKTIMTSLASSYQIHRTLSLIKPAESLDFHPSQYLHYTVVSHTTAQAKAQAEPLFNILDDSPWFKAYNDILTHHGRKKGVTLLNKSSSCYRHYRNCNLMVVASGAEARVLRRITRVGGVIDELSFMGSDRANTALEALLRSTSSVRCSLSRNSVRDNLSYLPIAPVVWAVGSPSRTENDPLLDCMMSSIDSSHVLKKIDSTVNFNPLFSEEELSRIEGSEIDLCRDFDPPKFISKFCAKNYGELLKFVGA